MRILRLNTLCGVKNQMYSTNQYVDANRLPDIQSGEVDINSLFWSKIFAPEHVKELLSLAKKRLESDSSPKVQAVLHRPEIFFETYMEALKVLETPVKESMLFGGLETLEIVCYLYSKLYSDPFVLTISEGYRHSAFSAQDLIHICGLPYYNPYLPFIESEIIPLVTNYQPDILVLTGKPNIASFAIAKITKERLKNIFIIAAEHESDYYSMRKIKNLLVANKALFSVYHCVVLDSNTKVIEQIKEVISDKSYTGLSSISGIIYSIDNGNTIIDTKDDSELPLPDDDLPYFDQDNTLNIKAFPQNHCYWNKCSFCGINSKYKNQKNYLWDVDVLIKRIKNLYKSGVKKIWLLDEAIPVHVLHNFAQQLLFNDIHIIWHLRTRIEPGFMDDSFAKLLWKSGLRHVLFGLESASYRILQLIHKTNADYDYLEVAEKIVNNFTSNNIAVHFSSILGFPTETEDERQETCNFLKYIFNAYRGFSYNVNMFYLDVGSEMYRRWEYYNISSLSYPCAPQYFLENGLDWNSSISPNKFDIIQREQEKIMVQQYNWYPEGALLSPSNFFSFWEYSRYCLQEHAITKEIYIKSVSLEQEIVLSSMISFCKIDTDSWLLYHLQNHHYVIGGNILKDLVDASQKEISFNQIIEKFDTPYRQKVETLIVNLTRMDFFILEKSK